ncbi:P-loop NTPase [Halosimplex sp. TS25]|uniref:DUF7125 family protein n=1 Tax=Halosimplex rarum TaxID=3396619 RepID=UPI0039EC4338
MIAIAGAKGGCGKTTTTLGLAGAFARAGRQSLAIDTDRQLPDLHVTSGVDREPTVTALDRDTRWQSVAQEIPAESGVHVLPGPKRSENVEIDTVLEWLDADSAAVLLDCPSGAGPDVIEPIAVADAVVVVTTGSDQSLSAAQTTVDVARRLEVPVVGAVVTHCDELPPSTESRLEVPVLAVVPELESPRSSDVARQAYDEAVAALSDATQARTGDDPADGTQAADPASTGGSPAGVPDDTSGDARADGVDQDGPAAEDSGGFQWHGDPTDHVATGIGALDEAVGGLPPGSVAVLSADPASQSEYLLAQFTATRGTLYITTERTEESVRHALDAVDVDVGSPTIRSLTGDGALDEATELVEELPDGSNLIVDGTARLERADRDSYLSFVNALKERMVASDGLALLHCLSRPTTPENRPSTEHVADAVFEFETTDSGLDRLAVPKFRYAGACTDPLELSFVNGAGAQRAAEHATGRRTGTNIDEQLAGPTNGDGTDQGDR